MVRLDNISKSFKKNLILKNLSIDFPDRSISCIIGPSGCGKTTLLNIISGALRPDSGIIEVSAKNSISLVFQDPMLLPWKTVSENVKFVLKRIYPLNESTEIARYYLAKVRLDKFLNHYPDQISNGMKQRVAIARALSFPAELILMDEPFNSLDILLKDDIIRIVRDEMISKKGSLIFVTHNPEEAVQLSDRIFVFKKGPLESYETYYPGSDKNVSELKIIKSEIINSIKTNQPFF